MQSPEGTHSPLGFSEHVAVRDGPKDVKICKLSEEQDEEAYFSMFERVATFCKWPESEWVARIAPCFNSEKL